MAVKGLNSFIKSSTDVLNLCRFRESRLIIDGLNLVCSLYSSSQLDQALGGEYEAYKNIVTHFFRNLKACDIKPYVVFDGRQDVKKSETLKTQGLMQQKISRAPSLSIGQLAKVLPTLLKKIFIQILRELNIPLIQCLAEADWEASALANEWNCPVLSNDSDFYIFGNKGGFLPIAHFHWTRLEKLRGSNKLYISAKWFGVINFCAAYNRMNKYHLPLFATILGNDYSKLDQSMFPNYATFSFKPERAINIDGLLVSLSCYPSPRHAFAGFLSPTGRKKNSTSTRRALHHGLAEYYLKPSSIAQFFLSGKPQSRPPGPLQNLPEWTLKPFAEGRLSSSLINILTLRRLRLEFKVEDFSLSSSHETSKFIRQVVYGILFCTRRQDASGGSGSFTRTEQYEVEEYDRQGLKLISTKVPAVLPRCAATDLYLDTLWETPHQIRLQVLLETLSVSPLLDILLIPPNLHLAVYITNFWLKNAQPEPKAEMFWALLIGLVYGELCREHHSQIEAGTVIQRLKNLLKRSGRKSLDLGLAHAYSQWLNCLKCGYTLNQLLNHPVPEPELARLYCGSLVHCVAHELMRGDKPESLLSGASLAVELYRNLQAAVERELDADVISRMRTRRSSSGRTHQEAKLSKMVKHLKIDEKEKTCSVRKRQVRRAHTKDPKSKKHECGSPGFKDETLVTMGVKGLNSFIESRSDVLKTRHFRERKLIIDGSSVVFSLYSSSQLDQARGGDYEVYKNIVTHFFRNLKACDIEPYVVFDGGQDVSDKKLETLKTRAQQKIANANSLSIGRSASVPPTLLKKIFIQVLRKFGVPFIQCLGEADWEAAALANEWNCPVLSNNSDFYIFGNKGGFLPFDHFQWKQSKTVRGSNKLYISAKWFGVMNLCAAYNRMNKYHLPLFATILGNDYSNLDQSMFPNWAKFSSKPERAANFDGLLVWLSRFRSPRDAIAALLSPMGRNKNSTGIRRALYQGLAEYYLKPSSIAQFFLSGEPQSRPPGPLQTLPEWTLKPFAEGRLSSSLINILMLRRVKLNFKVEDFSLSSGHETSKFIRQVVYGILFCTRRQDASGGSGSFTRTEQYEVEEYDRQELELISTMVPAVLPRCAATDLYLDTLWETPDQIRLQVLLETLSVSPLLDILLIPTNLHLAVYITNFWLKNAQPEPKAEMFWALLIGLVYGELCREHHSQIEAGTVIQRLKNLLKRSGRKSLDLGLAHAYSQWQNCLDCSYTLNQLLNHPVPEPELAWLYCGSLVHCVAHELMRGVEPESLLSGASLAVELYRNFQAAVERELDADVISRMRTRRSSSGRTHQEDELSKMVKDMMIDDEEADDGDTIYEETCSVRARHVRRAHAKDHTAKKHECVRWK